GPAPDAKAGEVVARSLPGPALRRYPGEQQADAGPGGLDGLPPQRGAGRAAGPAAAGAGPVALGLGRPRPRPAWPARLQCAVHVVSFRFRAPNTPIAAPRPCPRLVACARLAVGPGMAPGQRRARPPRAAAVRGPRQPVRTPARSGPAHPA